MGTTSQDVVGPPTSVQPDPATLAQESLREPVEYIETFLSQTNRAFLLGAGCSVCADLPLMRQLTVHAVEQAAKRGGKSGDIVTGIAQSFGDKSDATIEDILSELVDRLAIAERRRRCHAGDVVVRIGDADCTPEELATALADTKRVILERLQLPPRDLTTHREFVRAVHGRLESGRTQRDHRVTYFILNYDTLLEDALAMEQVAFADGFEGGPIGWWNPAIYQDNARNAVRLFKVHGSIDWRLLKGESLPRRFRHRLPAENADETQEVMIWPSATKYRETQLDPYAQMIASLRSTLVPEGQTEIALAICGYSFGDRHINDELDRALRGSNGRLTVLAFTNTEEPEGILRQWLRDSSIAEQLRVHTRRGFFHGGSAPIQSEQDLSWWQFEVLAKLLGGQR